MLISSKFVNVNKWRLLNFLISYVKAALVAMCSSLDASYLNEKTETIIPTQTRRQKPSFPLVVEISNLCSRDFLM